ncbi:hypothetical protein, partial [Vibrio owensii]|uniref:hypothetical protein n=1 Tax=Vibrio owensii TaxID=696485 RepID=UPI00391F066A
MATNVNYSSINECNSSEMVRVPSERNSKPGQESMKESSALLQSQLSSASAIAEHLPSKVLSKKNTTVHSSPEISERVESDSMLSPISCNLDPKTSNLKRQVGFDVEKNSPHKASSDELVEVQTTEIKCKANASLENSQVSSSQSLIEESVVSKEASIDGLAMSFKEKQKLVERKLKNGPKTPAEALIKQQEEIRNKKTSPPKTSVPDAPSPTTPQVSLKPGVIPPPP